MLPDSLIISIVRRELLGTKNLLDVDADQILKQRSVTYSTNLYPIEQKAASIAR